MPEKKRYIYSCRVIEPDARDLAHAYQEAPVEMHPAEIGEVRQLGVTLSEEGAEAYSAASNLIEFEEVTTATTADFEAHDSEDTEDAEIAAGAAGVQIPPAEDTDYAYSTWLRGSRQGQGVKVAVLDTALGAPVARLLSGHIAGSRSWVGGSALEGKHYHGGHVACTALPDNARLLHGAVLDNEGAGRSDNIAAGIHWAIDMGADIINMSLGGNGNPLAYERAIRRALDRGILVFCAAGNSAQQGNPVNYPAGCDSAVAIGAFDRRTDTKAPFSSFHPYVDLAHSGVLVLSYGISGQFMRASGTSMATPNAVWSAAGLQGETGKRGRELLQAIRAAARDTRAPATHEGSGVVHAKDAAEKLKPAPPKPPKEPGVLYRVQLGAFSERRNADALAKELEQKGYETYVTEEK